MGGYIGEQFGSGGRTELVVNHLHQFAFARQAQHGFGKVSTPRGVHPTGAENQMPLAAFSQQTLAFELGLPVGVERIRNIVFFPRLGSAAVEDVIGAVIHQPRAQTLRFFCQHADGGGVDGACYIGFAFGFIDRRMSRRIHNHMRRDGAYRFGKGFGLR